MSIFKTVLHVKLIETAWSRKGLGWGEAKKYLLLPTRWVGSVWICDNMLRSFTYRTALSNG
jgi:hypothetical protein